MFLPGPPSQNQSSSLGYMPNLSAGRHFKYRRSRKHRRFGPASIGALPPFKAPPGTKWVYETDGLSGLGRFRLKKIFKSIITAPIRLIKKEISVVKKVVKSKIGRIALLAAGAYFAAPWFLSLASKIGKSAATTLLQRHAPAGQTADEAARAEAEVTASQMPDWIAGPAQAYMTRHMAPAPSIRQSAQPSYADQASRGDTEVSPQARQVAQQAGETPSWVIPAAIGGAALLLITSLT